MKTIKNKIRLLVFPALLFSLSFVHMIYHHVQLASAFALWLIALGALPYQQTIHVYHFIQSTMFGVSEGSKVTWLMLLPARTFTEISLFSRIWSHELWFI